MDFHSMPRKQLQALCKKNKIPANITTVAMADALKALQVVEGMEEFHDPADSGPQPAQKAEEPKPVVPPPQPTSRRQATRRNAAADSEDSEAPHEPPSSPPQQTPPGRRGARASRAVSKNNRKEAAESLVVKELDGIPLIEIPDTPATAAAKQKTRRGAKTRPEPKEPEADDEQEEHPVEEEPEEEQLDLLPPPRTGRRGASKAASPARKKTTRRGAKARAEPKEPEVDDEQEEPEEEQVDLPPLTPAACAAAPAPRTGRRASTRAASTVKESEQKPESQLASEQQAELDRPRRATRRTGTSSETTTVTAAPSRTRGVRKMVDLLPDLDKQEKEALPTQEEKEEDAGVTAHSSAEDSDATLQPEEEQPEVCDAAPVPSRGRKATRTAVREPSQKQEEPVAKPSNRRRQTSKPPAVEGNVTTRRSRSRGMAEPEKHEQEVVSTEEEVGGNVRTRRSRSRGVAEPEKHGTAGNVRTRRSRSRGVPKPEKNEEEVAPTEEQVAAEPEEASSDSVVTHESVEEEVVCDLPPPTTGRRRASARASNVSVSAKQLEMTQTLEEQPVPEVRNRRRQSIRPVAASSTTGVSRSRRSKATDVQDKNEQEIVPINEDEKDAGIVATEAEQLADAHPPELVAESESTPEEEEPQTMDVEMLVEPVSALSPVAEEEEEMIMEEPLADDSLETKVEETDSVPEECVAVVFEEQIDETSEILSNQEDNDVAADFIKEMTEANAEEVPACIMQEECIDVVVEEADANVSSPVKMLDSVSAPVQEEDAVIIVGSDLSEQVVSAESGVEVNTLEIEDKQNEEQQIPSSLTDEEETDSAVAGDQTVEEQMSHPSTPAAVTAQKASALKMSASVRKSAVSTVRLASGAQRLLLTPEVLEARTEERTAQKSSAARFSTSVKRSAVSVRPEQRTASMMEALLASEEHQVEEELELVAESLDAIVDDETSVFCESVVADEPLVGAPVPPAAEFETEELNATSITNQEETTEVDVVAETPVVTVEMKADDIALDEYADVMEVDMDADVKEEVEIATAIDFVEQVATEEGVVDAVETEDAPMEEQQLPSTPIEDQASHVADDDALVPEVHQAQEPSTPAALSVKLSAQKASAARPTPSARKSAVSVRLAREAQQSPWTPASVSSSLTAQKASASRPPSTSARKSAVSVRLARESQLPPSTPAAASGSLTARKAPAATPSTTARKSAASVRLTREAQQAVSTPAVVSTPLTARKASAASAGKSALAARLAREAQQPPSTPAAVSASLTARKASAATPSTTARKSAVSFGLAREAQQAPSTPAAVSARKALAATPSTTARKSAVSYGFERLFLTPVQMEAQSKEKTCDKTRPSARRAEGTGSRSMASRARTVSKMAAQEPEIEQEHADENLNEAAVVEKSLLSELVAAEEPLQDAELSAVADVVEESDSSVISNLKEDIGVVSVTADFTDEVDDDGVVIDDLEFEDAWEEEQHLASTFNEDEEDIGSALGSLFKTPAYRSRAVQGQEQPPLTPASVSAPITAQKASTAKPSSSVRKHITEQVAVEEEDIGAALGSLFKTPAGRSKAVDVQEQLLSTPSAASALLTAGKVSAARPSASSVRKSAVSFRLASEAEKLVLTPMSAKPQPGEKTCPSSSKAARSTTASAARASGLSMIEALPITEDLELVAAKEELDGAAVQPAAFLESLENVVNETQLLESKEEDASVLEDAATAVDETVLQNDDSAVRDYWEEFVLLKEAEGECLSESHTGDEMAGGSWEAINDAEEFDEEEEEYSGEDEFFDLSEDLELGFGGFDCAAPCMFNNSASQVPVWWNAGIGEISELSAAAALRIAREVDEEDALKTEEIERNQQQQPSEEFAAPAIQSPAAADAATVTSPPVASLRRRSAATTAKKTKKKTSLTDDKENSMVLLFANATNDNAEEAVAGAREDDGLQMTDNKQQAQKQPLQEGGRIKKRCELPTQEELMAMSMRQLKKQFAALNLANKQQNSGAAVTLADAARECPNTTEKKKNNRSVLGRSALCPLSDNLLSPRPKC